MTKKRLLQLVEYVNHQMDRANKANNISISLCALSEKDLEFLRQHFSTVRPQGFMGYVSFERQKQEVA